MTGKRLLSLMLVALMLVSALSGCGTAGTPAASSAPAAAESSAAAASSEAAPSTEAAKDVTLVWWVGQGYTLNEAYANAADSPFHAGLIEQTGINIEWQFPTAGTDSTQAFNLMLASDTLPDIIFNNVMADAERYMEEGVIRDLTEYIADYSPAYYAHLQSNPAYDKSMKTDSGKYYGYGFFREDGGWNDTYLGPVVRQDWLREAGLKEPKTIADWDNVIRSFKDKYDATLSFAWSRFRATGISGAFGAYGAADAKYYVDPNGKVQLAQAQQEWVNYMVQLNKWWEDGLIDQDVLTLDDTAARAKALNNAMGISVTSMGQLTNWDADAKGAGNGAEWTGLQYPTGDDGTLSMVFGGYGIGNVASVITTACTDDELKTAMGLLDYAYTEEGNLYWNYGTKGVSWDYDANNEVQYLPLVTEDPDGLNNAISKYGGSTWSGSCIQATRLLYLKNSEVSIAANDLWFYPNEEVSAKWTIPTGVTFTAAESTQLDEMANTIGTFVSETAVKYITGEGDPAGFDKYLDQLNSMGLPKVLEIYQAAYDRFMAR
jgi:putative aldouronate transport system substrate-binding protein